MPGQLDLAVDPTVVVLVRDARGSAVRELRVGPLAEPRARELAGLLLGRQDPVAGAGPWRCAVAGGHRQVALEP